MEPLFAPYRAYCKFGRNDGRKPDALPVAWPVRADRVRSARVLVDCLKLGDVSSVEVVLGPQERVYVRWTD